jgi:uncharacterized protein YkwD
VDNEAQAQNEVSTEASAEATSPVVEDQTSPEAPEEGQDQQAEGTEDEGERKPNRQERRNAQREDRIHELTAKVKQLEQQSQLPQGMASPQFPQYQEGETVTPERLQRDLVQTAQSIAELTVTQRINQERAVSNLDRDTEVLPTKYPELNHDAPEYSPELEKAITEEFQEKAFRIVGYARNGQPITALDPGVRLAAIAKRYTDVARAAATRSSANTSNAVSQTKDQSSIRPQGTTKGGKEFKDLSIKEMEAKLGFAKR